MILVETPEGRTALIDGGRDVDGAVQALGDALPFWERNVDVMVLTHSDADHVGGLIEVLGRYDVGAVIDTTASTDTDVFEEWRRRLSLRVGPVVESRAGMVVDLGSGVTLETIWAGTPELSETNAASTVMMLRYGKVSMLLTGDIPQSVESRLLDGDATLAADLLKAPHHGSDSSSSVAFLEAVAPSIIVVSVGERNPFGHPDDDVLARYAEVLPGAPVFVTQDHGDVTVESDGARLWVETERQLL
jgi:competence protein ComEC